MSYPSFWEAEGLGLRWSDEAPYPRTLDDLLLPCGCAVGEGCPRCAPENHIGEQETA